MKTIGNIIHNKTLPLYIRDSNGYERYYEDVDGYWYKAEYDDNGNETYAENSYGVVVDRRWNGTVVDNRP